MKAGIVTFNSAHNYGAVLQTYALQEYIKSKKIDVEVINYRLKEIDKVYKIYKYKRTKCILRNRFRLIKKFIKVNLKEKWKIEKKNNFEYFINNVLNTTKPYKTLKEIQRDFLDYDILIAGSDQIWNTELTKGFKPAYFLEFGKKDARKISYAASIGTDEIPQEYYELYKRYINNFDFISVRETNMIDMFGKLTNKKIKKVIDPTLLHTKKMYDKLKKDTKYKGQDYIYVHYIGKDNRVYEIADKLSIELGLPIVHNRDIDIKFDNELGGRYNESPEEFLSVIENAKYIVSNSFHATVFSIIFNKDFITIPHQKRPGRMKELLESLGLANHLIEDVRLMPELKTLKIDYKKVNETLDEMRKESHKFLDEALFGKLPNRHDENYFKSYNKYNCYGCGLCKDVCPKNAITMQADKEGFVYPVIDKEKCINCGLCSKLCIYHNYRINEESREFPEVYAMVNKNKVILKNSSSGGIFTSLYKYVLKKKGYVVGVKYDKDMTPVYDITNKEKECEKFRGSKYVSALTNDIRQKVKEKLEEKKLVLFTGNPCQIAALRTYLKKDYENLILVDIICHGTPSLKIFKQYINYLEEKYNSKVIDFKFRGKKRNFDGSMIYVTFKNGKTIEEPATYNNYNRNFLSNYISRKSCYNCEFVNDNKITDLTIGDYWGIENYFSKFAKQNREGISVLKINTEKGKEIFNCIKDDFAIEKSNFKDAYRYNHNNSMILTDFREKIFNELDCVEINKLLQRYNKFKNKKNSDKDIVNKSL